MCLWPIIRVPSTSSSIYGFLGRNFKWMMKRHPQDSSGRFGLRVCSSYLNRQEWTFQDPCVYDRAREVLKEGMSLVVFPEGARSFHRSHGRVPPWSLHACRRIAVAGLSAYHQWQFRCQAPHEGYLLGILASVEAHYP